MADGGIVSIDYDSNSMRGCPTCDYGSMYIDDFQIGMTGYSIDVHINTMYNHLISEGWLMRVMLGISHELTEKEVIDVLYGKITECFQKNEPSRETLADPDYYRVYDDRGVIIEEKAYRAG